MSAVCEMKTERPDETRWPSQIDLILSAMETARFTDDRRAIPRVPFRTRARLRLFSDGSTISPRLIYTREVHARGLGFITSHRLPLGYGGVVELSGRQRTLVSLPCTLLRCREVAAGWYEGAVYFNREQTDFAELLQIADEEVGCS